MHLVICPNILKEPQKDLVVEDQRHGVVKGSRMGTPP